MAGLLAALLILTPIELRCGINFGGIIVQTFNFTFEMTQDYSIIEHANWTISIFNPGNLS
jgi:hypothetical protein